MNVEQTRSRGALNPPYLITTPEMATELRTQVRVDENRLKASDVDTWPALKARLEVARQEARELEQALITTKPAELPPSV